MLKNKVGELVFKAKGSRSYREYQKDSGVDAAIISKIVKGTYIPKSPDIYRKLTNCAENGVTFEDLINAAGYSAEYKDGMLAGAATSQAAITALGEASLAMLPGVSVVLAGLAGATSALGATIAKSNANKTRGVDQVEEYLNEVQRFSAISNGILFSLLAQKGILFQQKTKIKERIIDNQIDVYLKISNQVYSEYIIRYFYVASEINENQTILESGAKRMIEELMFTHPLKERKISLVTDSRQAFEYLQSKINEIAYKGNLSVILLDTQKVEFIDEIVLTTFDESVSSDSIKIGG